MSDQRSGPFAPPGREPILNLPSVVVWLSLCLALIQGGRMLLSALDDYMLMSWLAFVPARLSLWRFALLIAVDVQLCQICVRFADRG